VTRGNQKNAPGAEDGCGAHEALPFVASGAWKTMNFTAYKRERSGGKK
jgi:hypothetical protein